ncbi:MAG: primosomal protein N' [Minwuia sp.]|uniref:primosomal protein N' n=1 Tax=Minwuia sp. TaxID=2493630 RepID=UPI003A87911F
MPAPASQPDLLATAPVRVKVLLPLPFAEPYDYLAPADRLPPPGTPVRVPLGPRETMGVVWDETEPAGEPVAEEKLKPILEIGHDLPALDADFRQFLTRTARYYLRPLGDILSMVIRRFGAARPPRPVTVYSPTGAEPQRMTPARKAVMEVAAEGFPRTAADLAEIAGVGASVVKGLAEQGVLAAEERAADPALRQPDPDHARPKLNAEQKHAAGVLSGAVGQGFSTTLLEGVTGAGKTEVYCEAVAEALRQGKQVLVLLPEIALTQQIVERFTARFGAAPVQWHSGLSQKDRRLSYRRIVSGEARIVTGARSALYLPFPDLGLIVVDEEHDTSFKQEDGLHYHARDMAVLRGAVSRFPVVLVSATPSLESLRNVREGRYRHLELRSRFGSAGLPDVSLVDMRTDRPPPGRWISPLLETAVNETLEAGEQALLFLNRRGYAPLTLCDACGFRIQCPHCTAWLVEHRYLGRLQCHHCGYSTPKPRECPSCGAEDRMKPCGPGVERLAEEAQALFPEARLALMTSDLIAGPEQAEALIASMNRGEIDLLIGTQIVAKGHNFPKLTLVGVVDADLGLEGGDLRAAERTHQLLHQVAGRAGRADRPGRVLLQTHQPESPVLEALAAGDTNAFVEAELKGREAAGMPPYGRLAALVLSAPEQAQARDLAREMARAIPGPGDTDIRVLGPAPAPLAVVRGRHRMRFLVSSRSGRTLQGYIAAWLQAVKLPAAARLVIDIDPQSFL